MQLDIETDEVYQEMVKTQRHAEGLLSSPDQGVLNDQINQMIKVYTVTKKREGFF